MQRRQRLSTKMLNLSGVGAKGSIILERRHSHRLAISTCISNRWSSPSEYVSYKFGDFSSMSPFTDALQTPLGLIGISFSVKGGQNTRVGLQAKTDRFRALGLILICQSSALITTRACPLSAPSRLADSDLTDKRSKQLAACRVMRLTLHDVADKQQATLLVGKWDRNILHFHCRYNIYRLYANSGKRGVKSPKLLIRTLSIPNPTALSNMPKKRESVALVACESCRRRKVKVSTHIVHPLA
jgi:hypothetical protein